MSRVVVVVPTRSDPAHRRVAAALRREGRAAGHEIALFPASGERSGPRLRRRLERALESADVCHVQWFSRGLGYLEGLRVPAGVRLVLTHQGASLDLMERFGAFRALARKADAVTCVSRRGLSELLARLPELRPKACCVPNGADRVPLVRGGPSARPYALTVGRLAAYKGIDLLLLAFADVARAREDLDLVVCGPDQSAGRLPAFARRLGLSSRVRFEGMLSPAAVARRMARCSFFVLPSRRENMPMALLEAMGAGKAVAAADVGGVGELLTHGVDGLLVRPGDVDGLAAAMRRLAVSRALRERLGARARKRALSFSWSAVAAQYGRLYGGQEVEPFR